MGARRTDPSQWRNRPLASYLDDAVAAHPDKLGLVAYSGDSRTPLTYRDYDDQADRLARGLSELGVRRGDVVAVQLPNWWHFGPLIYAIERLRARLPRARRGPGGGVGGCPASFRGFDHVGMMSQLRPDLPRLEQVVVVEGEAPEKAGWLTFDSLRGEAGGLPA